jgi:hypothetical protein
MSSPRQANHVPHQVCAKQGAKSINRVQELLVSCWPASNAASNAACVEYGGPAR